MMTHALRLLRLEARHHWGALLFPLMLLLLGWMIWRELPHELLLWPESSVVLRDVGVVLGAIMAGVAAAAGGQARRPAEQAWRVTLPFPRGRQWGVLWGVTLGWGLLPYLVASVGVMALTGWLTPWPHPTLWPIALGALVIIADLSVGFALGTLWPHPALAPLVALGTLFCQQLMVSSGTGLALLSPAVDLEATVFYGVRPYLWGGQIAWFGGLTLLALALALHRVARQRAPVVGLAACGFLLVAGGGTLLRQPAPRHGSTVYVPYQPVCQAGALVVCVHPAYQPLLSSVAAVVQGVAQPLATLPGMVQEADQQDSFLPNGQFIPGARQISDETLFFTLLGWSSQADQAPLLARAMAQALVQGPYQDDESRPLTDAQIVVATWLVEQAGYPLIIPFSGPEATSSQSEAEAAQARAEGLQRFHRLEPSQQRLWLAANYRALQDGALSLEMLP